MKRTSFLLCGLAMSALAFTSCSEYSIMDDNVIRMGLFGEEYSENFEAMYGKISPSQTWDFSRYNLARLGLVGGPTAVAETRSASMFGAVTRALPAGTTDGSGIATLSTGYYSVAGSTVSWMDSQLPEGHDNRAKGNPFTMTNPGNGFMLIPLYQGHAGMQWDLHLVAKEPGTGNYKDYKLWEKSQLIEYRINYNNWAEFYYDHNTETDNDEGKSGSGSIKLVKAFPGITSAGDGNVKIKFVVPAQSQLKGKFKVNGSEITVDGSAEKTFNNTTDAAQEYVVDLSSVDKSNFANLTFDFYDTTTYYASEGYSPSIINSFEQRSVHIFTQYNYTSDWQSPDTSFMTGHTIARSEVRSKGIQIDNAKIEDDFFLYLKITNASDYDAEHYAAIGSQQRSDEGQMLALTSVPEPADFESKIKGMISYTGAKPEYMLIGCEDANLGDSDWDINDVCFLLVGLPKAPKIKETISKRYMIEDLGSTFDFDFNDIVVDVTQTIVKDAAGVVDNDLSSTKATVKHLCGTIPFKIQIGNTVLGSDNGSDGVFAGANGGSTEGGNGYNPTGDANYAKLMNVDIEGWNPNTNNIIVTTWPGAAGWDPYNGQSNGLNTYPKGDGNTFTFPENGKFPFIIACDQSVSWMKEMKSIPRSWFSTNPPASYDEYNNGSHGGGNTTTPNNCTEGTSIWSGNMTLNWENQKVENAFSSVNNDDVLHFHFSVTDEANAPVKIHLSNGWVSVADKNLSSCETKYCITYKVTDKSKLDQGIVFQGENCVLTGITVVPAYVAQQTDATLGETVNFALNDWADAVKISGSQLSSIVAGDKIVVTLSNVQQGAQIAVKGMWNNWQPTLGSKDLSTDETSFAVTVSASDVENIKNNGIAIQGHGFTVVSVSKEDAVKHTITVTAGDNGTVSGGGSYAEGATVTLTATPASGYRVKAWHGGSAEGMTTNSVQVTVGDSDAEYSVEFEVSSEVISDVTVNGANITISDLGINESTQKVTLYFTISNSPGGNPISLSGALYTSDYAYNNSVNAVNGTKIEIEGDNLQKMKDKTLTLRVDNFNSTDDGYIDLKSDISKYLSIKVGVQ